MTSLDQRRRLHGVLDSLWSDLKTRTTENVLTAVIRIPLPDGPVLLGLDAEGMPHLFLPVSEGHARQTLVRTHGLSLEVRSLAVEDRPQMFVDVACRRSGLVRVFLSLATEICAELAADSTNPLVTTRRLVANWRALFGVGFSAWTTARTAGTFAEVTVLLRLLERNPGAATAWEGPSGAAQDFRAGGLAIEVKASLVPDRRLITVHGWDQLDAPMDSSLHLAWFRLEEGSRGTSLRQALTEAIRLSGQDRTLIDIIAGLSLPNEPDPEVDGRHFVVREELLLTVDEHFPKVVPAAFASGNVPPGVIDMHYIVDLDTVPATSQVAQPGAVMDAVAAAI